MIRDEWILQTIQFPDHEAIPTDGRIRGWKRIKAMEGWYLRVIL